MERLFGRFRFARLLTVLGSASGLGVSSAIAWLHFAHVQVSCPATFDCNYLLESNYSNAGYYLAPIGLEAVGRLVPISVLAAFAFLTVVVAEIVGCFRFGRWVAGVCTFLSLLLQAFALFVLGTKCIYCNLITVCFALTFLGSAMRNDRLTAGNGRLVRGIDLQRRRYLVMPVYLIAILTVALISFYPIVVKATSDAKTPDLSAATMASLTVSDLVPPDCPSFGPLKSGVVVVVFAKISCGPCHVLLTELRARRQRNSFRVVYRFVPRSDWHDDLEASLAEAFLQGKFWQSFGAIETALTEKGSLSPHEAQSIVGFSRPSKAAIDLIARDRRFVRDIRLRRTPTCILCIAGSGPRLMRASEIIAFIDSMEDKNK